MVIMFIYQVIYVYKTALKGSTIISLLKNVNFVTMAVLLVQVVLFMIVKHATIILMLQTLLIIRLLKIGRAHV